MATDYPIEITDPDGSVRIAGLADFTDPDNQPGGPPFHAAPTGFTPIMVDSPDGDPILGFDADAGAIDSFYDWDFGSKALSGITSVTAIGQVDAGGLGPSIPYVTVQAGPPDPLGTYLSVPLVFDSTAVSGGLYAWDGAQYQQVGGPLA